MLPDILTQNQDPGHYLSFKRSGKGVLGGLTLSILAIPNALKMMSTNNVFFKLFSPGIEQGEFYDKS